MNDPLKILSSTTINRTIKHALTQSKNEPLFPFGYGLSYCTVEYSKPQVSSKTMEEELQVTVTVRNRSERTTVETVQLYVQDMVELVARPVKELKAF